ncbi:MAG: hypothetical protein H6799_02875 [Candidatus Nomurabacteria bacterium]|nr:MAG: hypothetical protein H6799_02875 [Candidatus Nomurabacteria bacterium]
MSRDVIVKEFGPEMAGQRVGWVTTQVDEREDSDYVHVNLAVGTVGEEGATYSYADLSEIGGGKGYHQLSTIGIVNGFSIEASVSRSEGIHPHDGYAFERQDKGGDTGRLFLGGASRVVREMEEADKQWALTAPELKDAIREAMQEADIFAHYPALYYLTNGLMCHGFFLERARISTTEVPGMLIADPEMANTTEQQIETARKVITELQTNIETDELMLSRLTVNSDIPAGEVPDAFVTARESINAHEVTMARTAEGLIAASLVYNPVGHGPGSRTYPFMGAHPGDKDRDFAIELKALKAKNIAPANHELGKELKELRARMLWAQQGCAVLRTLNLAEDGVGV